MIIADSPSIADGWYTCRLGTHTGGYGWQSFFWRLLIVDDCDKKEVNTHTQRHTQAVIDRSHLLLRLLIVGVMDHRYLLLRLLIVAVMDRRYCAVVAVVCYGIPPSCKFRSLICSK